MTTLPLPIPLSWYALKFGFLLYLPRPRNISAAVWGTKMTIQINADRLWASLMEMAQIGGTEKGGCNRQALTDTDFAGRMLFRQWCEDLDLKVTVDAAGNMFARYEGTDTSLPPLVIGSHLDTQATGGKFDGVLGVLAALEVIRVLHENGLTPQRPVEVVSWMNEEGARFTPPMMGSGVYAGVFTLDEARGRTDDDGVTVGEELDRLGLSVGPAPMDKEIYKYLELHIEQGPVLEAEDKVIGVVTGAQAMRWYEVTVHGQEAHAGPTPMALRKDPMKAVTQIIDQVLEIGASRPDSCGTVGRLQASPGSVNVIPANVYMSVDLRNPNEETLTQMDQEFRAALEDIRAALPHLDIVCDQIWHSPCVVFDPALINSVRDSAQARGYSHRDIVSGAGHDALYVARRVPTSMIFIPCRDGISHNEAEHSEPEHCAAGADVLLGAILDTLGLN